MDLILFMCGESILIDYSILYYCSRPEHREGRASHRSLCITPTLRGPYRYRPSPSLTVLEVYDIAPVRHRLHKPLEKLRWRQLLRVRYLLVALVYLCRLARFKPALLLPARTCRSHTPRTSATAAGATAAALAAATSRDGALHGCAPLHANRRLQGTYLL